MRATSAALAALLLAAGADAETSMTPSDLALTCRPQRQQGAIQLAYALQNRSSGEVWLLDTVPTVARDGRTRVLDPAAGASIGVTDGKIVILLGVPPTNRLVPVRLIPLGVPVAAGGEVAREVTLRLPLAEQNPYEPDLPLRDYAPKPVEELVLLVHVLRASRPGFGKNPDPTAPELYSVWSQDTAREVETVSCTLPVRNLEVLTRSDNFPRPQP